MYCDLHTHTNHSDGSYTPAQLISAAREKNLVIALTDHNTTTGLPAFMAEAERQGVTAVAGVELSTEYQGREFHLLGLFIDPEHYDRIERLCEEYIILKEKSNIRLVEKLAEMGYRIDYSAVKARNVKGNANRAHIAAELVASGYVSSVREAFDRLLDERLGIYVPPKRLGLAETVRFLREIGALPVVAHPLKEATPERLREMLPELIDAGLVGIETMHSSYSDATIAEAKQIAREFGLCESGGSDFHGVVKPDVELGVGRGNLAIDYEIYRTLYNLKVKE